MLDERRKFTRFDIPLKVEFKSSKDATEYSFGVTRNFSREGFSFESKIFDFEPKETIELRVKLPQKDTFVSILGDIIWKKQVEAKCLAGTKLREMDKEAKSEILVHAYYMWVEKMQSTVSH